MSQPTYPQYPPVPLAPAVARPQNGLGTAGFVLGLVGFLFSLIPIIGVIAWPLVILGLVFSIIGLVRVSKKAATNKGLAIAGTALSALGLVVCIATVSVFAVTASKLPAGSTTSTGSITGKIGTTVADGKFSFTVTKVDSGVATLGSDYTESTAQGQFIQVHIIVKNVGNEGQYFSDNNQKLVDSTGKKYDADSSAAIMSLNEFKVWLTQINPGNSVTGVLVYDVPKNVTLSAIELHDSAFSNGVTVSLK